MAMVDLDSDHGLSTSTSISDEETYGITEEFLLNNLLLFALRKGYVQGAEQVLLLYDHFSYRPPALAKWCLLAMKQGNMAYVVEDEDEEEDKDRVVTNENQVDQIVPVPTADEQRSRYEALLAIAEDFLSHLDRSSPYHKILLDYVQTARRLIIHLHLERFAVTNDHAAFLAQINRHFPAASSDPAIRNYRFKLSKMLLSSSRTQLYLRERWVPKRADALHNLSLLAWEVAQQFPEVFLDKLNTEDWPAVDAILLHLNTALALVIREYFCARDECVESDLVQIAQFANSQSIPSQLF